MKYMYILTSLKTLQNLKKRNYIYFLNIYTSVLYKNDKHNKGS